MLIILINHVDFIVHTLQADPHICTMHIQCMCSFSFLILIFSFIFGFIVLPFYFYMVVSLVIVEICLLLNSVL